jgi:hypothetical protein
VLFIKTWANVGAGLPDLEESRVPYTVFLTDSSMLNTDPSIIGDVSVPCLMDGPGWPVWASQNERILHFGTAHLAAGQAGMYTSYFQVTNGLPENVVNLKLGRRMNADDSLRLCISSPLSPVYPAQYSGQWVVQILSRMLIRVGSK